MRKPHQFIGLGSDVRFLPVGCLLAPRNSPSLVEILPSGRSSGIIRVVQRTGGIITGGLSIPRAQFFDFMEAIIHYAATIEPERGGRVFRKKRPSRPVTGWKHQDRLKSRRSSK